MLRAELVLHVYQVDSYIIWIVWFSLMPMFDDAVLFFICAARILPLFDDPWFVFKVGLQVGLDKSLAARRS